MLWFLDVDDVIGIDVEVDNVVDINLLILRRKEEKEDGECIQKLEAQSNDMGNNIVFFLIEFPTKGPIHNL